MDKERGKLTVLNQKRDRSYAHIEGPGDGYGPYTVKFEGVSLQLILVLETFIQEWKEELLEMVQDDDGEEENCIDFESDDND